MDKYLSMFFARLPAWAGGGLETLVLGTQVAAILLAAWLLMRLLRRLLRRLAQAYALPTTLLVPARRVIALLVYTGALLWSLERMGVSGSVLWTAFTGFAAVGAVAFFAAWSVLSNLFCALLIFTTRAFRPGDLVELVEAGDKPGFKGQVDDINLVYTTLIETAADGSHARLQLPNSLFFQRALRRWPPAG
ncbi:MULTISPECIES: mechanosensitive ion channel domain-containing protein [Rubrivivax]|nr:MULTISPECIES: mechanosensitive ion channel domain-containing protein [Rubrivivax]EGJ08769.1 small-conductance mechanosensitive channel-like protein [Rubrivivax benzoatilyticus JA2 = ATCC BAA-35]MCD0418392.1 mechanosensitive ion channel family protein [Rubrivivax sp. JA1024]